MKERLHNLQAKMEDGLIMITQNSENIRRYILSLKLVDTVIDELKSHLNMYISDIRDLHIGKESHSILKLKWNGSKSDLAEIIILLHLSESIMIDSNPISIVQLVELTELIFEVDLKDFKSLDYANRSRKKDITPFANGMIQRYNDRASRLI
jgi:hypothetical protein